MGYMETIVRDLMTSPAVTCAADDTLGEAARAMQEADTGSVVVTDEGKVVGILTERDLLRAAAGGGDPDREHVRLWMTARPDVLGPDERADAAWASLTSHHYRHLPVVEGDRCVGVVSLRDLMAVARIRPAGESSGEVPAGLEGVVVAETTIGDVRGQEGFFHYRQYSAVELAEKRSLEDVWHLLFRGELPDAAAAAAFGAEVRAATCAPARLAHGAAGHLPARCTARRIAHRGLAPGGRARLAAHARHRRRRALRPGARALRRGTDDPGGGPSPAPGTRARRAAGRPGLRRQLPLHADRQRAQLARTPGPSSST